MKAAGDRPLVDSEAPPPLLFFHLPHPLAYMPHLHSRFLGDGGANSSESAAATTAPNAVDSDFVVILAALVCALICVLGLAAVARCAWLRRFSPSVAGIHSAHHPPANKALKKKVLQSLVKLAYADYEHAGKLVDCAICLTEFAAGDQIRVLPHCGHGFHVGCIDMWLSSHSSCPLCRQVLAAAGRCQKCGGVPASSAAASAAGAGNRENDMNRFLP